MSVEYRDYGSLNEKTSQNVLIDIERHSQVYTATHDGAGNYLPHMYRSFISFTWGGKRIEDFNLLAIIENNALQRKIYADFNDNVTESDVWDGQIYWSSHHTSNSLELALFTDGITENQLDDFKRHFRPGRIEELILAEHPNRAIYARVAASPEMSILPFEEPITVMISGKEHVTSTTMYKGRINLEFVMDDPFWHSRVNILDELKADGTYNSNRWRDANSQEVLVLEDKDALKIITEDGVPTSTMLKSDNKVFFGTEPPVNIDNTESAVGS